MWRPAYTTWPSCWKRPAPVADVVACQAATGCGEYSELRAVPEAALAGFVAAERTRLVPAAPLFLQALGLLPHGA